MKIENVVPTPAVVSITNAIHKHNGVVIDDHGTGTKTIKIAAFGILTDRHGKQDVVALFDRSVGEYYSINAMSVDSDGIPHVTRSARGVMTKVTDNVVEDVQRRHDSFDWEHIAQRPAFHPGVISNVTIVASSPHTTSYPYKEIIKTLLDGGFGDKVRAEVKEVINSLYSNMGVHPQATPTRFLLDIQQGSCVLTICLDYTLYGDMAELSKLFMYPTPMVAQAIKELYPNTKVYLGH